MKAIGSHLKGLMPSSPFSKIRHKFRQNSTPLIDSVDSTPISSPTLKVQAVPQKLTRNSGLIHADEVARRMEVVNARTGLNIPSNLVVALMASLIQNHHVIIDTSFLEREGAGTGFALLQILPHLVPLSCALMSCTKTSNAEDIIKKLSEPQRQRPDTPLTPQDRKSQRHSVNLTKTRSYSTTADMEPLSKTPPAPRHNRISSANEPSRTKNYQRAETSIGFQEARRDLIMSPQQAQSATTTTSRLQHRSPITVQALIVDNLQSAPLEFWKSIFEIIQTRQITVKGFKHNIPPTFIIIAVMGRRGTPHFLTPKMQEHFLMKIPIGVPLYSAAATDNAPPEPAFTNEDIKMLRKSVDTVHAGQDVNQYMRNIVVSLRNHASVEYGPSPDATVAMSVAVRGAAVLAGQKFVTPSHVLTVAPNVLNHRISIVPPDGNQKRNISTSMEFDVGAHSPTKSDSQSQITPFQLIDSILETLTQPI